MCQKDFFCYGRIDCMNCKWQVAAGRLFPTTRCYELSDRGFTWKISKENSEYSIFSWMFFWIPTVLFFWPVANELSFWYIIGSLQSGENSVSVFSIFLDASTETYGKHYKNDSSRISLNENTFRRHCGDTHHEWKEMVAMNARSKILIRKHLVYFDSIGRAEMVSHHWRMFHSWNIFIFNKSHIYL